MKNILLIGAFVFASLAGAPSVFAYTVDGTTAVTAAINSCGYASNDTGYCAESFTTIGAGSIDALTTRIGNPGSSVLDYVVSVQADAGGHPSGVDLGSSDSKNAAVFGHGVACSQADNSWTFSTPVPLSASTVYWLVLIPSGYDSIGVNVCGNSGVGTTGSEALPTTSDTSTWETPTYGREFYFSADITEGGGGGGGTTASTTITVIVDPAEQLFDAFVIFFASMVFIIWLIRR